MRRLSVSLLSFCVTTLLGQAVLGVGVIDQSHVLTSVESQGGVGGSDEQDVAQTFRMGMSGRLVQLDFWAFRAATGAAGDLVFDIRPTTNDGRPVESDAEVLAQLVIPRDSVMPLSSVVPAPVEPLLIQLDLTPFNLYFQTGELVAFSFGNVGGNEISGFAILGDYESLGSQGPYENGQAFRRDNDVLPTEFRPWESTFLGPIDFGFRTYVEAIPEPSTLILLAMAALGKLRRRQSPR
jgi:hypothetical protein